MTKKIICITNDIALPDRGLLSEHGLSFWIETEEGVMLFDTGQTGRVLMNNLKTLGLDPEKIDALALSHAHFDHTGGLEAILKEKQHLPVYAHPDIFQPRYSKRKGEYESIGLTHTREDLSSRADLKLSADPLQIWPGLWTTGAITQRPEPIGSSNHHFLRVNDDWQPDDYSDDLSLVMEQGDGVILICGCCHAGLLNTLFHIRRLFDKPIHTVIGGTHLWNADGRYLRHVIDVLDKDFPDMRYFLNHCTGEDTVKKFAEVFGDRVAACPAGTVIDFNS